MLLTETCLVALLRLVCLMMCGTCVKHESQRRKHCKQVLQNGPRQFVFPRVPSHGSTVSSLKTTQLLLLSLHFTFLGPVLCVTTTVEVIQILVSVFFYFLL